MEGKVDMTNDDNPIIPDRIRETINGEEYYYRLEGSSLGASGLLWCFALGTLLGVGLALAVL
jgi:hypothetical protein